MSKKDCVKKAEELLEKARKGDKLKYHSAAIFFLAAGETERAKDAFEGFYVPRDNLYAQFNTIPGIISQGYIEEIRALLFKEKNFNETKIPPKYSNLFYFYVKLMGSVAKVAKELASK